MASCLYGRRRSDGGNPTLADAAWQVSRVGATVRAASSARAKTRRRIRVFLNAFLPVRIMAMRSELLSMAVCALVLSAPVGPSTFAAATVRRETDDRRYTGTRKMAE